MRLPDFERPALEVAPQLLGSVLRRGRRAGVIVEVEAYGNSDDPASHAFRGPTARNEAMFGLPGGLYVYLIYGIHLCANVVCGPEGVGGAVLIRALRPTEGLGAMRVDRPKATTDNHLCSGPGKLAAALGICRDDDGTSLVDGPVRLEEGGTAPLSVLTGPRVGISKAVDRPWRFALAGDPNVSRPRLLPH